MCYSLDYDLKYSNNFKITNEKIKPRKKIIDEIISHKNGIKQKIKNYCLKK